MKSTAVLEWPHSRWRILPLVLFFVVYSAAIELALHSSLVHIYAGAVWPANGLALAGLLLWGVDLWPAIALSSLGIALLHGDPLIVALGSAVGDTIQALVGAYILKRFDFDPMFARLRDPFLLIVVSLTVTLLGPTITLAVLWAEVSLPPSPLALWSATWTTQILSTLVLTSFLLRWARPFYQRTRAEWIETALIIGALLAIDYLLFWTHYSQADGLPLIYLILIPLIWIALRLGPRWMTFALLATSVISLSGVVFGNYPHSAAPLSAELLDIKVFVIVLSVIFLLFVASEESRKETAKSLGEHVGQLEYALQKISAEDRAKNEFIAVLAHELRNPLAPIVSSLEIMRLRGTRPEISDLVDVMYEHTSTMARLLDDLLDISRISQRKLKLQKEEVMVRSAVLQALQTVEPIMQSRGHSVVTELPDEQLWIKADPVRLEQILVNLLSNAAKYTPKGGSIKVAAHPEKDEIVITVSDTGIGVESHMLTRIFEPFVQVERGKQSAGLGIGLSLTKRLVEMHRGTIEARSAGLGKGSAFIVRLPLPAESVQLPIPISRPQRALRRAIRLPSLSLHSKFKPHKLRILVVDDNEAAAQGLCKLLTYRGNEVSVAYSGEAALEAAGRANPQVVILDIGLPGMDGYEVAGRLRQGAAKDAVIVALTGYGQDDDKKRAAEAGFAYHLTKPVGLAEVEAVLAKIKQPQEATLPLG